MLYLLPFLKTGNTMAFFQAEGNCPLDIDELNNLVMTVVMPLLDRRSMWLDSSSEPIAPERRTVSNACATSVAETARKEKLNGEDVRSSAGVDSGQLSSSGMRSLTEVMKCWLMVLAKTLKMAGVLHGHGVVAALALPKPVQDFTWLQNAVAFELAQRVKKSRLAVRIAAVHLFLSCLYVSHSVSDLLRMNFR